MMKRFSLFAVALIGTLFASVARLDATDYQVIRGSGTVYWDGQNPAHWLSTGNGGGGVPVVGHPNEEDNLYLQGDGTGIGNFSAGYGDESGSVTRKVHHLIVNAGGGVASLVSRNNWDATVEIMGNLTVQTGRSLSIRDSNNVSVLRTRVLGTVEDTVLSGGNLILETGATLHLGGISASGSGSSITERLTEIFVAGTTTVGTGATLLNSGGNISSNNTTNLGDLEVNGSMVASAGGDGTTSTGRTTLDYLMGARSLSGGGTVYGSSMIQEGARHATLALDMTAATDATFSGGLHDSSSLSTGSNTLALSLSGPGQQTLTGANTYSGQTVVASGTLRVEGSHVQASEGEGGGLSGDGLYRVSSGGVLGGSGRIAGRSSMDETNMVYVGSGGIVAPGMGTDALRLDGALLTGAEHRLLEMASGAAFSFELAGDSAGRLSFWNYGGSQDVGFNDNLVHLVLHGPVGPGTYEVTLIDFYNDDGMTAAFAGITSGLTLDGAQIDPGILSAQLLFNDTNISLQYTVVPEPGSVLLGASAAGVLIFLFRRKRRSSHRGRVK